MARTNQNDVAETEADLIAKAQQAVSSCNWVVGQCAANWTERYARGRTDADFAALVGLSADQVYQRRRVWETFGDVCDQYPSLKWSHFYLALNWNDAPECLQWAEENQATVAEMKAWRRAINGEDLTAEPDPDQWAGDPTISFVPSEPTPVRDPDSFGAPGSAPGGRKASGREPAETVAAVARGKEGDYSPYRKDAGSPAPKEGPSEVAVAERPKVSADKLLKKMTTALERMNESLSAEVLNDVRKLPEKDRQRFIKAVGELSSKAARLMS